MTRNIESRLAKIEERLAPKPQPLCIVSGSAEQCGLNGTAMDNETEAELIARHLAKRPEDAGREFGVIRRVFIHGVWNDRGEWVCDEPTCTNFSSVRYRQGEHKKADSAQ